MTRPPAIPLDDIDLALLASLRQDGRMPLGRLGETVGLSRDAVGVRLKRLTTTGALQVVGSIDPVVLGFHTIALVGVTLAVPVEPFAETLVDVAEFDLVACTAGRYDLLLEAVCTDEAHLMRVLDEQLRGRVEVQTVSIFIYLDVMKFQPDSAGRPRPAAPAPRALPDLTENDLAVIVLLQADGRLSYQEIAARTGLHYQRARRCAKALIENGVITIHTTVNRLAERSAVAAAIGLRTTGSIPELQIRLGAVEEVEVAVLTTGPFDMFLDVVCRDREHLAQFVGTTLREIEGVRSTETLLYTRLLKLPRAWSGLIRSS